jgi:hypothetical protein
VRLAGVDIPQEILVFAGAAVGLGGTVVLVCLWRIATLLRERRAAHACVNGGDIQRYLERQTPFATCLADFVTTDPRRSQLSADTVALLAVDALEGVSHAQTDGLRYWSYTPLLAGLCGTVIGLIALLRSDPDTMQQHLGGVLFGTLTGIGASLVASSTVSWLDGAADATRRAVARLVFQRLLPTIPERKIALAVEEQLLEIIADRSKMLVDDLGRQLTPLAEALGEQAQRSADAATVAAGAFETATKAIEGAPVLADVVGQLLEAADNARLASVRLTADAERLAALHQAEDEGAAAVRTATEALNVTVERLLQSVDGIHRGVLSGEPQSLASTVRAVDTDAKALTTQVGLVAAHVSGLGQELVGLSTELKQFGANQVEALGKRLLDQTTLLVETVREQLEGTPGKTVDALRRVGATADAMALGVKAATASIEELERRSQTLVAFLNARVQTLATASPGPVGVDRDSGRTVEVDLVGPTAAGQSLMESAAALRDIVRILHGDQAVRAAAQTADEAMVRDAPAQMLGSNRQVERPGLLRRAVRRLLRTRGVTPESARTTTEIARASEPGGERRPGRLRRLWGRVRSRRLEEE